MGIFFGHKLTPRKFESYLIPEIARTISSFSDGVGFEISLQKLNDHLHKGLSHNESNRHELAKLFISLYLLNWKSALLNSNYFHRFKDKLIEQSQKQTKLTFNPSDFNFIDSFENNQSLIDEQNNLINNFIFNNFDCKKITDVKNLCLEFFPYVDGLIKSSVNLISGKIK
jgi:hypothetical protein